MIPRLQLTALVLTLAALLGLSGCCSGDGTREATAATVGQVVEVGRGVASGVAEGVDEGREGTTSVDGAHVMTNFDQFSEHGQIEIAHVRAAAGGGVSVRIFFRNNADFPMRVAGLGRPGQLLLVDAEEVANPPQAGQQVQDLTVPPHSRGPLTVVFPGAPEGTREVRVWGHAFPAPAPSAPEAPAAPAAP